MYVNFSSRTRVVKFREHSGTEEKEGLGNLEKMSVVAK